MHQHLGCYLLRVSLISPMHGKPTAPVTTNLIGLGCVLSQTPSPDFPNSPRRQSCLHRGVLVRFSSIRYWLASRRNVLTTLIFNAPSGPRPDQV
jgi:hypothetical protein